MNELKSINLYDHNKTVYKKVDEAFRTGENIVGIVHATGTGKSYIALQLLYDNLFSNSLFLVPSNSIKEHIINIINKEGLNLEDDFPNLNFMTYSKLCYMSDKEIKNLDIDLIVLDEFHHMGAPVWGEKIKLLIDSHPDAIIFGMTAYTIRDRNTAYERDMAIEDGDEVFSSKIVSRYDLADAMVDEVLPVPIYRTSRVHLKDMYLEIEKRVSELNEGHAHRDEVIAKLKEIKDRVDLTNEYQDLIKTQTKKDGKYIYFCNPGKLENGQSCIEYEMEIAKKEFIQAHGLNNDYVFYISTSNLEDEGAKARDAFYHDKDMDGKDASGKLRVMFCVNQYNEGVHAPGVDGVILGRFTKSDIVYYEQIGRALNVSDDTLERYKVFNKMNLNELAFEAKKRGLNIIGLNKEEIVNLLISPVIIDLSDNVAYFKSLENSLKDKVRERKSRGDKVSDRIIKLADKCFDIEILNEDLYQILVDLRDKTATLPFSAKIEEAHEYYKVNRTLPASKDNKVRFSDGVLMGAWIHAFKKRIKSEAIGGNLKAQVIYDYKWPDKLGEAYDFLTVYGYLPLNSDTSVTFSNGSYMGYWVYRNKAYLEKLKNLGDKRAAKIYDYKWHEIDKIEELYEYYKANNKLPMNTNKEAKFSDGVLMGSWLYLNQSYIYKKAMSGNEHAKIIYDIRFPAKVDKIGEAYNYFIRYGRLPVNSDRSVKFQDGSLMGAWFFNNKTALMAAAEYGDERAKFLCSIKWPKKNDKLRETYEFIMTNGFVPQQDDKKHKFSDGRFIGAWIYRHKKTIEKLALDDEMARTIYSKAWPKKVDKIHEAYEYLVEHHFLPVGNDKTVLFSDYSLMGQWLNDNKKLLIDIAKKGNREAQLLVSVKNVLRKDRLLCMYGLNTPKYKSQLEHVNAIIIAAKCKYIICIGESIVDGLGNLHKCFFMTEEFFNEKYGLSYDELIRRFLILDEYRNMGDGDVPRKLS